jgi:thiol:disulfide interchange protein DsbD
MRGVWRCVVLTGLCLSPLFAAREDPVQWSLTPAAGQSQIPPGAKAYFELKATIQPGWHLYSPTTPAGGPIITKLRLEDNPALISYSVFRPQPVRKLDPNFQIDTETYTDQAVFLIEAETAKSAAGEINVEAGVRYQACTDVKSFHR